MMLAFQYPVIVTPILAITEADATKENMNIFANASWDMLASSAKVSND